MSCTNNNQQPYNSLIGQIFLCCSLIASCQYQLFNGPVITFHNTFTNSGEAAQREN